jgi:hypothetical protein
MSSSHLSCPGCHIRVRSTAYGYDLLEGACPICEAPLTPVSSAAGVIGFRLFDLDALSEQQPSGPPPTPGQAVSLIGGREAALARDDADRWSGEGGSISVEAVAEWPAAH